MALDLLSAAKGGLLALKYLDISIKVAKFLISERLPSTVENIKSFFRRKNIEKPQNFELEEARVFVNALMNIDTRILDVLKAKVNEAINEYVDCLKSANSTQEGDACDRNAERSVCENLNRIMKKNNGNLTSEYLESQWSSFGCVKTK